MLTLSRGTEGLLTPFFPFSSFPQEAFFFFPLPRTLPFGGRRIFPIPLEVVMGSFASFFFLIGYFN